MQQDVTTQLPSADPVDGGEGDGRDEADAGFSRGRTDIGAEALYDMFEAFVEASFCRSFGFEEGGLGVRAAGVGLAGVLELFAATGTGPHESRTGRIINKCCLLMAKSAYCRHVYIHFFCFISPRRKEHYDKSCDPCPFIGYATPVTLARSAKIFR